MQPKSDTWLAQLWLSYGKDLRSLRRAETALGVANAKGDEAEARKLRNIIMWYRQNCSTWLDNILTAQAHGTRGAMVQALALQCAPWPQGDCVTRSIVAALVRDAGAGNATTLALALAV
jgi:hypothetical protein